MNLHSARTSCLGFVIPPKVILPNFSAIICENPSIVNGYEVVITRNTLTFANAVLKPESQLVPQLALPDEKLVKTKVAAPYIVDGHANAEATAAAAATPTAISNATHDIKDEKASAAEFEQLRKSIPALNRSFSAIFQAFNQKSGPEKARLTPALKQYVIDTKNSFFTMRSRAVESTKVLQTAIETEFKDDATLKASLLKLTN